MISKRTKDCKRNSIILTILHLLCTFGPLAYFIPYAFFVGAPGQKLALSLFLIVATCLVIVAAVSDLKTRGGYAKTIMWFLVIGVTICLNEVKTFVYIMAVVAIVDELIITKLKNKYKDAYAANREIDRRE